MFPTYHDSDSDSKGKVRKQLINSLVTVLTSLSLKGKCMGDLLIPLNWEKNSEHILPSNVFGPKTQHFPAEF